MNARREEAEERMEKCKKQYKMMEQQCAQSIA